jgi:hypothetical protein
MIIPKWLAPEANDIYPSIVWVKKLDNKKIGFFKLFKYYGTGLFNPKRKR